MEIFRADDKDPQPLGISLSTWISMGLIITSVVGILKVV